MPMFVDLTGKKFGRLTVICRDKTSPNKRIAYWLCFCECGNHNKIRSHSLTSGLTRSCGCLQKEKMTTHGKSRNPLYQVWLSMKRRCGIIKGDISKTKRNYIDRKITVCNEWLAFSAFYGWARDRWHKGLDIDRKNTNGNYTPENCRFVTRKVNSQNKRNSKRWVINGEKYNSAQDAAKIIEVSYSTIRNWCCGYRNGRYRYPPKDGCYAVNLY